MRAATRVLDSYSVLAHLKDEPGAEQMDEVYRSAKESGHPLLISTVNWGEVFYITLRKAGRARADQVVDRLSNLPLEIVPADLELTRDQPIGTWSVTARDEATGQEAETTFEVRP